MFACLFVPDFRVQAVLRLEPETSREILKQSPVAILDGPASLPRVVATNEPARLAGIEMNMTRQQVETCGRVWRRKRSPANENAAQAALLDCAASFSPRMESTAPGTVILDLAGTEKLFGSTQALARKIAHQAAEFGFELNIAVAANPDTAFYAARGFAGITMIPPGEEAERLSSLTVDVLSTSPEMLDILDSWGIRNFHALALLPPVPVVERLGQEGLQLQKIARGETRRPIVPAEAAADFVESFEFDDPVETLESLTFILNRLLQQICARLTARSLATNELRLKLGLEVRQLKTGENKEFYERTWKLPLPIQDPKVLFRLAYLDLEGNTQPAPIEKIIVQAVPVKPRYAQSGLFAPASPETEQLEITLARIRGIVGSTDENGIACVGSPRMLDSHKPDSFTVQAFSGINEEAEELDSTPADAPIISLRIFRPALQTAVELAGEKPCSVSLHKKQLRVLAASGPWRSSGNWWSTSSAWARDEWDVALKTTEGVGFYRIYLDRIKGQWFVEGGFD
jgi:protein ImuB